MAALVRLQKYMADCGAGSRRKCEEWIVQGQVSVNGGVVVELGTKIDPDRDEVRFRGKVLRPAVGKITVMLHKPAGYVTTVRDQFNRPNVCELVKIPGVRLYPVGRLDYQTTGLLLLTNDGDLDYLLTHPKNHIPRVYEAVLRGHPTAEALEALESGVKLAKGVKSAPAVVRILKSGENATHVEFTLYEGKNHEVRQMAQAVGFPVLRLKRIGFAGLSLGNLQEGHYCRLKPEQIEDIKSRYQPQISGKRR